MTGHDDARQALRQGPMGNLGAWRRAETAMGTFHVAACDGAIVQTGLPNLATPAFLACLLSRHPGVAFLEGPLDPLLVRAATQLAEYAAGRRQAFDVPVRLEGTEFQRKVWAALAAIPFGSTRSYQDVARAVGRPGGARAVGQANHENPVAPFVPCHRVVTSTGLLGGYGGGVGLKRAMLELEGVQVR